MTNKWQEKLKKFQEARKEKSAWYEKIGREILEKYQITACHKCDCRGWGRETKHSRAHAHTKKRIVCLNAEPKGYRSFFILLHEVGHIVAEKADYSSGVPNRGAKPDTQTAVGSLGWIRKTTMWASLVEVCFLTNPEDMKILHGQNGYDKAARGIANGICEMFGVPKLPNLPSPEVGEKDREKIKLQIIKLVNQL